MPTQKKERPWVKPIKELRAKFRWNQSQLAEALGVGQTAISRWESGDREPSRQAYEDLYLLSSELPIGKFFWDRANLSNARLEYLRQGFKYRLEHPVPALKSEVFAGQGTYEYVNSWARLIKSPPPVALPLLKEPQAIAYPKVSVDQVEEVVFFSAEQVPHPEATRCIVGNFGLSWFAHRQVVVAIDTFEKSPAKLNGSLVAARDPAGEIQVACLTSSGDQYVLFGYFADIGASPRVLSHKGGWRVLGKVLFWIEYPQKIEKTPFLAE